MYSTINGSNSFISARSQIRKYRAADPDPITNTKVNAGDPDPILYVLTYTKDV